MRLYRSGRLNDLLVLQKLFINIHERVLQTIETSTTEIVYIVRIISNATLERIMKNGINGFVSIGIFILATKSLITARTIARQMADNSLNSILFQISIGKDARFLVIDSNSVVFSLGSVFRLESISLAPDGVYYAKIKTADSEFRLVKEQIQFEIKVPFSWLTYGNYLYFLNQCEQAKIYFEYLLKKLPKDSMHQPSIYNNMALIYAMENGTSGKTAALKLCGNALKCAQDIISNLTVGENRDQSWNIISTATVPPAKTSVDRSAVLASIADVYYQKGDYQSALQHYEQALKLSSDLRCRLYYQQMIETAKVFGKVKN